MKTFELANGTVVRDNRDIGSGFLIVNKDRQFGSKVVYSEKNARFCADFSNQLIRVDQIEVYGEECNAVVEDAREANAYLFGE